MLVFVVALFAICWLPLHVFILVLDFNPQLYPLDQPEARNFFIAIYYTVHWLAMSNSFVNPIIYGFLNDSFRVCHSVYRQSCHTASYAIALDLYQSYSMRDTKEVNHQTHSHKVLCQIFCFASTISTITNGLCISAQHL